MTDSIKTDEADLKKATEIREKEAADFAASEKELVETVDTLGRAIDVLEKKLGSSASALAQVDMTSFNTMVKSMNAVIDAAAFEAADKQKITALLQSQEDSDDEEMGAPAAAAYKSKSGSIVDVLEDMKEKADDQLATLRKAETEAKHNYGMLAGSLKAQLAQDNKELADQKAAKAEAEETNAVAKGELESTKKTLAETKSELETTSADCMTTAADHEKTVAARNEELKVIAEARQIIKEAFEFVQESPSLLQLKRMSMQLKTHTDLKNSEVVVMVKRLAKAQHSKGLAQLASRISSELQYGGSAGEDVFAKIKGLISDMIAKLEREAEEDANEKAYCDEQMGKTEEKQSELEDF